MERAKELWDRLGLPALKPEVPWYGYSLGDWTAEWDERAAQAVHGDWMQRDESYRQRRRSGVAPNTPVRSIAPEDEG
jgi:4-hydroxy-3-polyprenylbenzoate decarboxylase